MIDHTLRDLADHIEVAAHDPQVCLGCLALVLTGALEQLVEAHPEVIEPERRLDG